eukprot:jgi/Psemu1/66411/estExt_Genemark1.C_2050043
MVIRQTTLPLATATTTTNPALVTLWRSLRAPIAMIVALPVLSTHCAAMMYHSSTTMIEMPSVSVSVPELELRHRDLAEDLNVNLNSAFVPSFASSIGWNNDSSSSSSSSSNNETLLDDDEFNQDNDDTEDEDEDELLLCEELVDNTTYRFDANPSKDCGSWVAERPLRRCRKMDSIRNQLVRSACPWTCHKTCRLRIDNNNNNNTETESSAPSKSPSSLADPTPTTTPGGSKSPTESPTESPSEAITESWSTAAPTRVPTVGVVASRDFRDPGERTFGTAKWILVGVVVVAVVVGSVAAAIAVGIRHGETKKRRKKRKNGTGNQPRQQQQQQQQQQQRQRNPSTDGSSASSVDSCSCYLDDDYGVDNDYDYNYDDDCWSMSVVSIPPLPPNGDYERRDDRRTNDIENGPDDSEPAPAPAPAPPETPEKDSAPATKASLSDRMASF